MANSTYAKTKREKYEILRAQLEQERASFIPTWRDLGDYFMPRRPRFFVSDTNKGDRRSTKIINTTPLTAVRTIRSGMMSGITSPARPWFRLTTPDPDLAEFASVKKWLSIVEQRMRDIFLRSNLYNALPIVYGDMAVFGTGAMMMEEDFQDVVRFYTFPIGSYMIGVDERGHVNTFFREFRMTVRNLISKFGQKDAKGKPDWTKFSLHVRNLFDQGNLDVWIDVCHVIQPNDEYDPEKLGAQFKRFTSCYYEKGFSGTTGQGGNYMRDENVLLRESGYDFFPVMAPRWEVTGEDAYGTASPGWNALGDNKQLQLGEKRLMQAIEKMVNPPMVAHPSMKTVKTSILPGDISYAAEDDGKPKFRPAHVVDPRVQELILKNQEIEARINEAFFKPSFLMFSEIENSRDMTIPEIDERSQEKLLILGPMLEQSNQDLHTPLIDNTFDIMLRQSLDAAGNFIPGALIPEPPPELDGVKLKVEQVSIIAQAQKRVGLTGVERTVKFALEVAGAKQDPTVLDKIDFDQTIDIYGDMTSLPVGIIRSDEDVAKMREARQAAQAEQEAAATLETGAKVAKDLAGAKLEEKSALSELLKPAPAA